MSSNKPTAGNIAQKAYEIWEAEGRPEGRDVAHWHQAERDISEPVIEPIPDTPTPSADEVQSAATAPEVAPTVLNEALTATGDNPEPAPKPRATRARKPKPADSGTAEASKPKTTRRRKAVTPEA